MQLHRQRRWRGEYLPPLALITVPAVTTARVRESDPLTEAVHGVHCAQRGGAIGIYGRADVHDCVFLMNRALLVRSSTPDGRRPHRGAGTHAAFILCG